MRGAALLVAVSLFACGGEESPRVTASLTPRATLVLEPATLLLGSVATVDLAVVTPPGHQPRPFAPPADLAGLWLLEAESAPVSKHVSHWVHHTGLRVRAREVGTFAIPGGVVVVDGPEGIVLELPYEPLSVTVASVLPEYPDRLRPFGAAGLGQPPSGADALVWSAAGAGLALAAVGLVWLARRRTPEAGKAPPQPRAEPPWVSARSELSKARALVHAEPVAAADAAAKCLRRYVARRFGGDGPARTTEELEKATPPFTATTRWPAYVALLRRLDALRFPPGAEGERVAEVLREVEGFVDDSVPFEERA